MATRIYLDKSANKLDVLECSTLVVIRAHTSGHPLLQPGAKPGTISATPKHRACTEGDTQQAAPNQPGWVIEKAAPDYFERLVETQGPALHLAQQLKHWLIGWIDRNSYNIYANGAGGSHHALLVLADWHPERTALIGKLFQQALLAKVQDPKLYFDVPKFINVLTP